MQYNINVANGTGMEVRTNLNLAHQSLATNFFGATDPSLMSPVCAFPGSTWADTGNGLLKVRNADDSDWIVIGTIESDGTPKLNASGISITAADVPNVPDGEIESTNVQDAINELASMTGFEIRKASTDYSLGDISYDTSLPSWARLECTTPGVTGSGAFPTPSPIVVGGVVTDGTVVWTIKRLSLTEGNSYASAPNYYEESEAFYDSSQERENNTELITPEALWVNVDGQGYSLESQLTIDINEHNVWDYQATEWQPDTVYAINQRIYPQGGTTGYMYVCTTPGTSSTLIPTFPTTVGETYNDGSVVWTCEIDYTYPANRKGKDFYIFACEDLTSAEVLKIIISANSTVPIGYTALTSRKIGGFHCLCEDVGVIANHPLSDYIAGDILPCSIWDLKHRPIGYPEGYAYDEGTDMWYSIYGLTWSGTWGSATADMAGRASDDTLTLESKFGAEWADGTSTEKFHCYKFEQILSRQKQRLPYQREFVSASLGSNQSTNVVGLVDKITTGGHKDTANRRMISNIGLEDCCGDHWQWGADVGYATTGDSSYGNAFDTNDRYVKGQWYGAVYRPVLGGSWSNGAVCGSRGSYWYNGALSLSAYYGARGASEPTLKRTL